MSTRCQVKILQDDSEILLYHHCDGYPEGVGFCLLKLMERCKDWFAGELATKMVREGNFEVSARYHLDIEYLYEMDLNSGRVRCFAVDNWEGDMRILDTIRLVYDKDKDVHVADEMFEGGAI